MFKKCLFDGCRPVCQDDSNDWASRFILQSPQTRYWSGEVTTARVGSSTSNYYENKSMKHTKLLHELHKIYSFSLSRDIGCIFEIIYVITKSLHIVANIVFLNRNYYSLYTVTVKLMLLLNHPELWPFIFCQEICHKDSQTVH